MDIFQRCMQNPVKQLSWSFSQKWIMAESCWVFLWTDPTYMFDMVANTSLYSSHYALAYTWETFSNNMQIIGETYHKISELHKGTKHPQCNSDYVNKIEERSNITFFHPNCLSHWSPGKLFFKTWLYEF